MSLVEKANSPLEKVDEATTEASRVVGVNTGGTLTTMDAPKVALKPRVPRKKRKATTVLAVGASREVSEVAHVVAEAEPPSQLPLASAAVAGIAPPVDDPFAQAFPNHMPLELIPPVIPENTTGKPSLRSFCSAYPKPKKPRRGGRTEETAAVAPVPPAAAAERPAPQHAVVQIVNGEIVLQESSIVFHGSGADAPAPDEVVEEEAEMAVVGATYTSFATGRRARPNVSHWTVEETRLFYEALRQVGLDFGTMEAYFESASLEHPQIRKRLRRQLKRKYQAEYSKNPVLIEKALQPRGRVSVDLSVFQLTEDSIREMEAEKEKRKNAVESTVAVAVIHDGDVAEDAAVKASGDINGTLLWPDTAVGDENEQDETEDVFGSENPIFFDDTGVAGARASEPEDGAKNLDARLVLEYSVSKKVKRPKFRTTSRKKVATKK